MRSLLFTAFCIVAVSVYGQDNQKFSLGTPSGARFTTPDITWPAAHGDADVCLWEDDKLAAISLTIDDNSANDHTWWMARGDTLGFKFTWFVITGIVQNEPYFFGCWDQFRTLNEHGHAVQSHSTFHGDSASFYDTYGINYTEDWYHYYDGARQTIEDSVPGNRCYTLAAPGSGTNNLDSAALYYIATRGTGAMPNYANKIDFKNSRASSAFNTKHVNSTLDDTTLVWGQNYRRGWTCFLWHSLIGDDKKAAARASLDYVKEREDSLWVGRYPDVVRYNMEYATHTLAAGDVSDSMITFTLADEMADTIYTYPLTVKVRLNNDWDTCIATQDGEAVDVSVVEHEGDKYALVKAVPDGGEVMLSTGAMPVSGIRMSTGAAATTAAGAVYYDCRGRRLAGPPVRPGVYMAQDRTGIRKVIVLE